jgi:hypothetical protein
LRERERSAEKIMSRKGLFNEGEKGVNKKKRE